MARVIQFYIPDNFKPKPRASSVIQDGQLLEFPRREPGNYQHPTWIFPEVDADLSLREGRV